MSSPPPAAPAWPRWLVALASAPIVFHLASVALAAVAAPSGPWPTQFGPQTANAPPALVTLHEATRGYLQAAGVPHDYHFPSNHADKSDAYLEFILEDEAGSPLKTVRYPDPGAPTFVRRRQARLIRWLVEDQVLPPPPPTEQIPPPGPVPRVTFWNMTAPRKVHIERAPEVEGPRGGPIFRPTAWSMVLVRSAARHVCRTHGAAAARVLRYSRDPVSPEGLRDANAIPRELPPEMDHLVSDYGRMSR